MATGPCPNCKAPITIDAGQTTVTCDACGAAYQVTRVEGRTRLRRAQASTAAPASSKSAARQPVKRPAKQAAGASRQKKAAPARRKSGGSSRAFIIAVLVMAGIFVVGLAVVILLIAGRPGQNLTAALATESARAEVGGSPANPAPIGTAVTLPGGLGTLTVMGSYWETARANLLVVDAAFMCTLPDGATCDAYSLSFDVVGVDGETYPRSDDAAVGEPRFSPNPSATGETRGHVGFTVPVGAFTLRVRTSYAEGETYFEVKPTEAVEN